MFMCDEHTPLVKSGKTQRYKSTGAAVKTDVEKDMLARCLSFSFLNCEVFQFVRTEGLTRFVSHPVVGTHPDVSFHHFCQLGCGTFVLTCGCCSVVVCDW